MDTSVMLKRRRRDSSECGRSGEETTIVSPPKMVKKPSFIVRNKEMTEYFRLLEDPQIYDFIRSDRCKVVSDKYLLAMVFAYFKRSAFHIKHYSRMNFFTALYLANDMEEDEEEYKYEIFPWALGKAWRDKYMKLLRSRDRLWARIGYRAVVSRKCCEEIIAIEPTHWAWQRLRPEHHGGASRAYIRDPEEDSCPRGPDSSPRPCRLCAPVVEYDSASPESTTWYLSSSTESSPELKSSSKKSLRCIERFNMRGLKTTLDEDEGIWACEAEP